MEGRGYWRKRKKTGERTYVARVIKWLILSMPGYRNARTAIILHKINENED